MNTDVFISYRRKDSEFVKQLHQELTERGISAWFDREDIEVADHWRTSIAQGIRNCQVFVLVLSPDAVESTNIRKEVDLAEDHQKKIVPVMWRSTPIPEAFEYALAGIQYIEFNEVASKENFDQLAQVIQRLLGQATLAEAMHDTSLGRAPLFPAAPKEDEAPPEPAAPSTGRRVLGGRRTLGGPQLKYNPLAIYQKVISKVITAASLDLSIEDQDFLNSEIKWLFAAVNHLYRIQRGEAAIDSPIPVAFHPDCLRTAEADNTVRPVYRDKSLIDDVVKTLDGNLNTISRRLRNLNILVDREVFGGAAAKQDISLQNQLQEERLEIVKQMEQMAATAEFYFEINVINTLRDLENRI